MNWVKQFVRISLTKCANQQRRVMLRIKGLAPVQHKLQIGSHSLFDSSASLAYPIQSIEVSAPTMKEVQKRMADSHGLLDLVSKGSNIDNSMEMGDFSVVTQENFAHALHFSKAEIDFGTFNLDEIETVCSQTVEGLSVRSDSPSEANYLDESENSSNISYTETEIIIELPNSEVIENSIARFENPNQSASF